MELPWGKPRAWDFHASALPVSCSPAPQPCLYVACSRVLQIVFDNSCVRLLMTKNLSGITAGSLMVGTQLAYFKTNTINLGLIKAPTLPLLSVDLWNGKRAGNYGTIGTLFRLRLISLWSTLIFLTHQTPSCDQLRLSVTNNPDQKQSIHNTVYFINTSPK